MECKTVMGPTAVPLYADEPAGNVIDFMKEKRSGLVPVVDRNERFVGMISGDRFVHFMLPPSVHQMRDAKVARFIHESKEEYRERLDELRGKTVGDLIDKNAQTVSPETPLIDALMLICGKQFVVPVVDDDGKLVGAISFFSLLHWLQEEGGPEDAP